MQFFFSIPEKRFVLFCLVTALVMRVAFVVVAVHKGWTLYLMDEVAVAESLLRGDGYSFDYFLLFGSEPTVGALFPPAYVVNVYVLARLFHSETALFLQNALFSTSVSACIYFLTRSLFGWRPARLALAMSVFYLPFSSRLTHGSPLYFKMFLMCLLVMAIQRGVGDNVRMRTWILAGVVAGVLALAMPDIVVYLALVVAGLAWGGKRRIQAATVFLVTVACVLFPWSLRNWLAFDEICLLSTNGGMNFYMGHHAGTTNEVSFQPILELDSALHGELARANEFQRDRILYREALSYIRHHPGRTLWNMSTRAIAHWGFRSDVLGFLKDPSADFSQRAYAATYVLLYLPLLGLFVWGLWRSREQWPRHWPILLVFAYSTLVTAAFVVQTKQRLAKVEPFMFPYAATALIRGRSKDAET